MHYASSRFVNEGDPNTIQTCLHMDVIDIRKRNSGELTIPYPRQHFINKVSNPSPVVFEMPKIAIGKSIPITSFVPSLMPLANSSVGY